MNYIYLVIAIAFGVFWGISMYKNKGENTFTWENQKKLSEKWKEEHDVNRRQ